MSWDNIITAISSIGFPIVAACGMFYLYDNTIKNIINTLNMINSTMEDVKNALVNLNNRLER